MRIKEKNTGYTKNTQPILFYKSSCQASYKKPRSPSFLRVPLFSLSRAICVNGER